MTPSFDTGAQNDHNEGWNMPQSPGADYGLSDGFDPAIYDFYNPISHNVRRAVPEQSLE